MKTIGLLGGMTSESSLVYYRLINEMAREKLGGNHSAKSVMVSVDFAETSSSPRSAARSRSPSCTLPTPPPTRSRKRD